METEFEVNITAEATLEGNGQNARAQMLLLQEEIQKVLPSECGWMKSPTGRTGK